MIAIKERRSETACGNTTPQPINPKAQIKFR
jgi:hypothetical protein